MMLMVLTDRMTDIFMNGPLCPFQCKLLTTQGAHFEWLQRN